MRVFKTDDEKSEQDGTQVYTHTQNCVLFSTETYTKKMKKMYTSPQNAEGVRPVDAHHSQADTYINKNGSTRRRTA